jgi:hypothetical protein
VRWLLPAACFVAIAPAIAAAHGRSVSYSIWTLGTDGAHVELRLARIDLTLVPIDPWAELDRAGRYATERLRLVAGDRPCTPVAPPQPRDEEGWIVFAWDVRCPAPPTAIESHLFTDVAPSHLHFARASAPGGGVEERVLTDEAPRWERDSGSAGGSTFVDYVRLGVDHIRTGWDHLAFVLALLLLASSLSEVTALVTSFTLAHSVTLGLATLGVLTPQPAAVEALIGFSIALAAIENVWLLGGRDRVTPWLVTTTLAASACVASRVVHPATLVGLAVFSGCHFALLARSPRPARLRAAVAFGFGLVHGLGFAGVLAELALPRHRLVPALLGFNLGVELGQLVIVTLGWTALVLLERGTTGARRRVAELGSAAIAGLGVFWFVTRGWG